MSPIMDVVNEKYEKDCLVKQVYITNEIESEQKVKITRMSTWDTKPGNFLGEKYRKVQVVHFYKTPY